jgi:tetratricopeptide (TPR) repeat protein
MQLSGFCNDSLRYMHQYQKLMNLANDEQFNLLERKEFAEKAMKLAPFTNQVDNILNSNTTYGYILSQEGNYAEAFKVFQYVKRISDSIGYKSKDDWRRKAFYLNIEGILYKELGVYDLSQKAYYESLRISDSVQWKNGQTTVLNNISNLFLLQDNIDQAIHLQHKSFIIAQEARDTTKIYDALFNLMAIYADKNIDSAFYYVQKCEDILPKLNSYYQDCYLYLEKANILLKAGQSEESLKIYLQTEDLAKANHFYELHLLSNKGLAKVYENLKDYKAAEFKLLQALELSDSLSLPKHKTDLLFQISAVYKQQNNINKAYDYLQKAQLLSDSLNASWKSIQQSELHQIYELQLKNQENKLLEQDLSIAQLKIDRRNTLLYGVIFVSLALLWILLSYSRKRKLERQMNLEMQSKNKTIHQQEKQIAEQKETYLKEEINNKTRQLATYSLSSIKHVEATENIINKISQLIYNETIKASTKQELQKVIQQMKQDLMKSDWEEFKTYYEEIHPSFYENLVAKHPDLSANDEKLCAFISLGLSTKDIASLTFRQVRSVESARLRLRKKLNLEANDSIFDYLKNF